MLADLCIDRQAVIRKKEVPFMECDQESKLLEQVKKREFYMHEKMRFL